MNLNNYFIIEMEKPEARNTWPNASEVARPYLIISARYGNGKDRDITRPEAVYEWSDVPPPSPPDPPGAEIVVVFELPGKESGTRLGKSGLNRFAGYRTWFHYGGELDFARIRDTWRSHDLNKALGADQARIIESEFGFPLPVIDRLAFNWRTQWSDFKSDLDTCDFARLSRALDAAWAEAERACKLLFGRDFGEWVPLYHVCQRVTTELPGDSAVTSEQLLDFAKQLDETLGKWAANDTPFPSWSEGPNVILKQSCAAILQRGEWSEGDRQRLATKLREAAGAFVASRDSTV